MGKNSASSKTFQLIINVMKIQNTLKCSLVSPSLEVMTVNKICNFLVKNPIEYNQRPLHS